MNILKKCLSALLSVTLVGSTFAIGIPLSSAAVSAAEITEEDYGSIAAAGDSNTGSFNDSVTISYKASSRYKYNPSRELAGFQYSYQTGNNTGTAFCAEPIKGSPTGSSYSKTFSGNLVSAVPKPLALNALYYGYGGPGFETVNNAFSSGNSGYDKTSKGVMAYYRNRYAIGRGISNESTFYYAFTHLAIAYAMYGNTAFGTSGYACYEWKDAVIAYCNLLNTKINTEKSLPDKQSSVRGYIINTGADAQNIVFAIFKMRLEFQKISSSTFTSNNPAFSLAGAQFTVFTDKQTAQAAVTQPHKSEARAAGAITDKSGKRSYIYTDENGTGHFNNFNDTPNDSTYAIVDIQDYYIVEHRVPTSGSTGTGFELNNNVYRFVDSGRVDSNGYPIYVPSGSYNAFVNHAKIVLQMTKTSSDPVIVEGNSCYSLAGAVYGIYTDRNCTNLFGTITTDEKGNGTYLEGKAIQPAQLWAKELTPSPGYLLDESVYKFEYSGKRETKSGYGYPIYSFESVEEPDSDPLTVLLQKYDATTGEGTNTERLKDAEFTVKFYPKQYTTVEEIGNAQPLRSWVFKTDDDGYLEYSPSYKVSGDDFWYQEINGELMPTLPYGTITVQETKAPPGYQLNNEIYIANINSSVDGKISWRTTNVNEDKTVLKVAETQDNGGLEIRKMSSDNKVEGLWFRVSADGYSKDFETDSSGLITNSELSALDTSKAYTVTELGYKVGDNQYHFPRRYGEPPAPQTVTLQAGHTTTVTFRNNVTPTKLVIQKESDDNKKANIWFEVTASDGTAYPYISTDSNGKATLKNLPAYDDNDNVITYTVKELGESNGDGTYTVPKRYLVPASVAFDFTQDVSLIDGTTVKELVFINRLRPGTLTVNKTTSPSTYNSQGIWFNVSSSEGYSENKMIVSSNSSASLIFSPLDVYNSKGELIEYTVTELGYKNNDGTFYYPSHFYKTAPVSLTLEKGSISNPSAPFEVVEGRFINRVKNVKLDVHKTAYYNDVSNVCFRLTSDNGYNTVIKTNSSGVAQLDSLPIYNTSGQVITYTLEELGVEKNGGYVFPERYVKPANQVFTFEEYNDDEVHLYTEFGNINPKGNVTVDKFFDNTPKESNLKIIKTSDDHIVEGFYFNVKSSLADYGDYATNEDGEILFTNLPVYDANDNPIIYTVTELGFKNGSSYYIPERYDKPTPQSVTLNEDGTVTEVKAVYFHNTVKPGKIRIVKTSDDDIVEHIFFKVTNLTKNLLVGIYETDADGVILTEELPAVVEGETYRYKVEELGFKQGNGSYLIPNRYITPAPVTIELKVGGTALVNFNNTSQLGYLAVFKTRTGLNGDGGIIRYSDDEYNTSYRLSSDFPHVSGARIGLYTDYDCTNLIAEAVTDSDGYAVFGPIPFGTYYACEIEAPDGYFTDTNRVVTFTPSSFQTSAEEAKANSGSMLTNTPASFWMYKFDNETYEPDSDLDELEGEGLSGCLITVYNSQHEIVDQWITNGEGHEVTGREHGKVILVGETYTIEETDPADGFSVAPPIHYTVKDAELNTIYDPRSNSYIYRYVNLNDVVMINTPTETYITKTDITGSVELEGASLTVSELNGELIESWISTKTPHLIKGLVAGRTYILTETTPPIGFSTTESIEFTVNSDGSPTHVEMKDETTKIKLEKIDENGQRISGVRLQVIDDKNEVVDEWTSDANDGHDVTGILQIGKTYRMHEVSAPPQYVLSPDVEFTVADKKTTQVVTMENKFTETYFTKTDITGTQEIPGAYLSISVKDGNVVEEWISTEEPHLIKGLLSGQTYILTETQSPDGYTIAESIEFTVNTDGTPTHVEMKDDTTKVEFIKLDVDNQPVKDCVLQVIDSENNVVDEWTTDGETNHVLNGVLIVGQTYKLHEVSAPLIYELAPDTEFTVENVNDVQVVQMTNHLKVGRVTLIKRDENSDTVDGSQWLLFDNKDNPVKVTLSEEGVYTFEVVLADSSEALEITTKDGQFTVNGLPQGSYYFKETTPPDGTHFPYTEKVPFSISADNETTLNPVITVTNHKNVTVQTGGNGDWIFYIIAGIGALLSAVLIYITILRKKEKINMKKLTSVLSSIAVAAAVAVSATVVPTVASAAELDTTKKVKIGVECSKPGFTFEAFKIASLDNHANTTANTYDTDYTALVSEVATYINDGDTASIVSTLDAMEDVPTTAVSKGTWTTSATSTTYTFNNLDQGVYYIRATNYPAGVTSVTGSVIALPYYDGTKWIYEYTGVNLAAKVETDTPSTEKTITNSTKNNVNFTDVSLGDTVNFNIKSKTAGSASMKLNSYIVYDEMSKGLTLNKNSFTVTLLKADGTKAADVAKANYDVNITSEKDGQPTVFNVSFKKAYLQTGAFYASGVKYTSINYSAVLNKHAIVGPVGNPNDEVKLAYSNKNDVTSEVEGNTVYVYTYALKVLKKDENGDPLKGATFKLYKTEADAKAGTGEMATAVSGNDGTAMFKNASGVEMKFQSGKYFAVETDPPEGYNVYGKVIPVDISATYGTTLTNNTYVTNAPSEGIASFTVTDTKIILPKTGGNGGMFFYILAAAGFAIGVGLFIFSRKKDKNADKE